MPLTITWEHLPDSGAPQVGITVSGVVGTQPVTVEVSWDGGVSWRGVRGARLEPVTEAAFFRDFVPPLNTPIRYRVTCADGSQAVSDQFQPGAVAPKRTNEFPNPRPASGAFWGASPGETATFISEEEGIELVDPVGGGGGHIITGTGGPGAPGVGRWAAVGVDIKPLNAHVAANWRTHARVLSGAAGSTGDRAFRAYTLPVNQWSRTVAAVRQTDPTYDSTRAILWPDGTPGAGAQFRARRLVVAFGSTQAEAEAKVSDYFDGDTAPSASGIPAWVGERNASASVMWEAVDRVQSDTAWAQDPLNPKGAVAVATYIDGPGRVRLMRGSATEVSRPQPVDLAYVQGASSPVASVGTRSTPVGVPLVLRPLLDLAADQGALVKSLRDLIDTAGQVVLRGLPIELGLDPVAHYVAPGVVERPSLGGVLGYHEWEMSLTQVRPQSLRVVVPFWAYQDVADIVAQLGAGATYSDVLAAMQTGTTYLDALRNPRVLIGS